MAHIERPVPAFRLRVLAALGLAAAGLVAGGLWALHGRDVATHAPFPSGVADELARRVSAAHADVTAVWRHEFRWRLGRTYLPPELVTFVGSRPSPCAGARAGQGPFYCPVDRTLSLDLAFLGRLDAHLRDEGRRGTALIVARLGAEHVQEELAILGDADRRRARLDAEARRSLDDALVLQADCLAGVWARRAAGRLGELEPGAWARVIAAARLAAAPGAAADRLDLGSPAERDAAFAAGHAEGELRACLDGGLAGVLG